MNFTHELISELLLEIATSDNGTQLLMQMTLETFMKSERILHQPLILCVSSYVGRMKNNVMCTM